MHSFDNISSKLRNPIIRKTFYKLIEQKGMIFDHDFGYSFPLFSSLLKIQGREKENKVAKIVIKRYAFLLNLINSSTFSSGTVSKRPGSAGLNVTDPNPCLKAFMLLLKPLISYMTHFIFIGKLNLYFFIVFLNTD